MEELSYLRLRSSKQYNMPSDCLVDNWPTRARVAFIDLTAGPFQWGPLVGGEGVRSIRCCSAEPGVSWLAGLS